MRRWGWTVRGGKRLISIDKSALSRLANNKGSLDKTVLICKRLEMAPPREMLSERQVRLLRALEDLRRALELRYEQSSPRGSRAIESALEAFVAGVEADLDDALTKLSPSENGDAAHPPR
jgi:hypothetical protein